MKKPSFFLAGLLTVSACSWLETYPSSPEGVCMAFVEKIEREDIDGLKQYLTVSSQDLLESMKPLLRQISPSQRQELREQLAFIRRASCRLETERAVCTLCCNERGDEMPESMNLVKVNGRWLLDFGKSSSPAEVEASPPVDEVELREPNSADNE